MIQYKTKSLTTVALTGAVLCLLGPLVIPLGVIPMSLTGMGIYLISLLFGGKKAAAAVLLYLLIGVLGIPVFSGFTTGPGIIMGPTGGYLLGYLPASFFCGSLCEKICFQKVRQKKLKGCFLYFLIFTGGNMILYFTGSLWLSLSMRISMMEAFGVGVFPFLLTDSIKNILAVFWGMGMKKRLEKFF